MRWIAKKFFWSMVLSAASLMIIQFFPQARKYQSMAIQMLSRAPASTSGSYEFRHGEDKDIVDHVQDGIKKMTGPAEPETVTINGRVYPKSPDNTYTINGEKIFFIDNKKADRETASTKVEERPEPKEDLKMESLPVTPSQMLEVMQKAGAKMKERNKVLDEALQE